MVAIGEGCYRGFAMGGAAIGGGCYRRWLL